MAKSNRMENIKNEFTQALDEGDVKSGLISAVAALRKQGMDLHAAAHTVTHWAVEYGLFPEELEDTAAEQAEQIVQAAE
jgi:hypothetical protein